MATPQRAALDRSLFGGILWTAGAKWSSQLFTWVSLVVVIRFISPADFGLVGLAGVFLDMANIIGQSGFGSAAITLRDLTDSQLKQINAFAVLSSILMVGISCAAARPLGLFFHASRLPMVLTVMSLAMLAAGVQTIPYSLCQRQFRFKLLSVNQTVTSLMQSLSTLILAILGWGYWALVIGYLVGAVLSAAVLVICEPRGFEWPRLKSIHHALRFSAHLLVARLSWSFYNDSDKLISGRVLGTAVLGQYSLAWNLATMPVEKVTSLVGQVTRPIFSASQTDYGELRRYLLLLTEGLSVITFPMGIGLALTAHDAVPLIFGKAWFGAVVPLQILAFFGCATSVSALIVPLLTSLRDTRYVMLTNLAAAFIMPAAFYLGSHWGAGGIAAGWIIAYPIVLLALARRAFRKIALSGSAYAKALGPATSGVAVLAVAVTLVRYSLLGGTSAWTRLILEIAVGAASYVGALLILHRHRVKAVAQWYRRMRAGEPLAVEAS
jgi:polysaccharide transporter, PST family